MTKKELDEEIEYVHRNIPSIKLVREFDVMFDTIIEATTTYTNLSLLMNDYFKLYISNKIDENMFNLAMNNLYLLALLHTYCDEDLEYDK